MTGRVHDMILDPKLTGQLPEVIAEGEYYGMQTFDQHLLKHLRAGPDHATTRRCPSATSPHDFKLMVAAGRPIGAGPSSQPRARGAPPAPAPAARPTVAPPSAVPRGRRRPRARRRRHPPPRRLPAPRPERA